MDESRLRRWVQDRRAVEARERADARVGAGSSRDTIAHALGLVALYGRLHGWPAAEDDVSRREDAQMYDCWYRLRVAHRRTR